MLNGIAPILIFYFPIKIGNLLSINAFSGIPVIGVDPIDITPGIPIPIYLDERLTGIYIESETKALDIDTVAECATDGSDAKFSQRGLSNTVTINMLASSDSVVLAALLALNDIIFTKVVSREYSLSYLNGTTLIFKGLLHSFQTSVSSNDNLIRISMQIAKTHVKPTISLGATTSQQITGATPKG